MFRIALVSLGMDILFTWISFLLAPENFALIETNQYLLTGQWSQILGLTYIWFALLWCALKAKSRVNVLVGGVVLVVFRGYAVMSHPVYWMHLMGIELYLILQMQFIQIITPVAVFLVTYLKWLEDIR